MGDAVRHSFKFRLAQRIAATAASLLLLGVGSTALAGSASATQTESACVPTAVQWSPDGGSTWRSTAWATAAAYPLVSVLLRYDPAAEQANPCPATFSLNSYTTDGPTWDTTGTQVLLDHATTTLDATHQTAALSVATPKCYGQTDLYRGSTRYDGTDGPVPHYPDVKFPSKVLVGWSNGGQACEVVPPPVTPPGVTTPGPANPQAEVEANCDKAEIELKNLTPQTTDQSATFEVEINGAVWKSFTVAAGDTMKVTYTPDKNPYQVDVLAGGQKIASATTENLTCVKGIVIPGAQPPAVEPAVIPTAVPAELPHTGAGSLPLALAGAGLLLLGTVLVASTRRRRGDLAA
jgi:LPXTG-motif cell wall-anchored protein